MATIERLDTSISRFRSSRPVVYPAEGHEQQDNTIALRLSAAGSSFFWAMQFLPYRRREAMYALYAFRREVDDIANSDAPRSLKDVLLSDWRSEIALLYAGRPQQTVTRALSEAVRSYGLKCGDFLAIIDGMEMDARTDIRAPSLIELDLYCERVAVAVGRLSVRIFGEETAAGERVAAALGRALQLTNILRDLPKRPAGIGCICLAKCCGRMAFTPRRRAGCWPSRPFRMFATTWRCLPNDIMRQLRTRSPLARAGQCARQR